MKIGKVRSMNGKSYFTHFYLMLTLGLCVKVRYVIIMKFTLPDIHLQIN